MHALQMHAVRYSHRLLQYPIVEVTHEHTAETHGEPEPFVLPERRFARCLPGGHANVQQSRYGHGHRSCVPIHSTGDR